MHAGRPLRNEQRMNVHALAIKTHGVPARWQPRLMLLFIVACFVVPLAAKADVVAGDDTLQALPGDLVVVSYIDEKFTGDGIKTVQTRVKCVEGNFG